MLRHDAVDYDVHARSIAQGEGFSKTLAHGRPTAFRPPGYPYFLGAVYHVFGADREPTRRAASTSRASPRPSWGRRSSRSSASSPRSCGDRSPALVALGLAAIYLPFILVGGAVMSEPLFDVFMLASLAAALAYRRSRHRYRWALLAGVLGGLADADARAGAHPARCRWPSPVWDGRPWRSRARARAPGSRWSLAAAAGDHAVDDPQRARAARLRPDLDPVRLRARGHLQRRCRAPTPRTPPRGRGSGTSPTTPTCTSASAQTPEAVLERKLRAASLALHPRAPGLRGQGRMVEHAANARPRRPAPLARHRGDDHHQPLLGRPRDPAASGSSPRLALAGAFTAMARRAPLWVWADARSLMFLSVVFLVVETPRYRTPIDPFLVLLATAARGHGGAARAGSAVDRACSGATAGPQVAAGGSCRGQRGPGGR